jgi:hypothetical protein
MAIRKTSSTAYNIMLTTEIINLDLCVYTSILKENKQELEFLKDHGSNNQLFLTLRKQLPNIQKTDKKIHDMSSAINEIDMEFEEIKNVNIETIGSLSQITRP